ncbi:hypothetical protein ACJJTC_007379 [Scirpophaga incertulas]
MKSFRVNPRSLKLLFLTVCVCMLLYKPVLCQGPVGPIALFIRTNFVGDPVIHNKVTWIFDPYVGIRRSKQFVALNGDKGERLIEKLGLGIDGREEEYLLRQRARDEGHLGGLNYFLP